MQSKQQKTTKFENPNLQDLNTMPQKYKQLWVTNCRLLKQISILKLEISQKDRIIKQLKIQIDSTILEDTKNKLEFVRIVQDQVNQKTQKAKQQYLEKLTSFETQFEKRTSCIFKLEKQIEFYKQQNNLLNSRIIELKEHVIVALEEKDLIIRELTKIISQSQVKIIPKIIIENSKSTNVKKSEKQNHLPRKSLDNYKNIEDCKLTLRKIQQLTQRDLNSKLPNPKVIIKKNI